MLVLAAKLLESDGQQPDAEEELDKEERLHDVSAPPGTL